MCSLNIHEKQVVVIGNYVNCFVRLFTCMAILKDLNVADPLIKPLPQLKHQAQTRATGMSHPI
jgi:hypothetical protein